GGGGRGGGVAGRLFLDGHDRVGGRLFQKAARLRLGGKHFLHAPAKVRISRAGLVEIGRTLLRHVPLQGGKEDHFQWRRIVHASLTTGQCDRRPAIPSRRGGFSDRVTRLR